MSTIQNLNATHIADEVHARICAVLDTVENEMTPFLMNLSVKERRRYGSISEQNKLFVNKTHDYSHNQPELRSPDVDWTEFDLDYIDRNRLEGYIARLDKLRVGLNNAKTLSDFDNYQAALDDYAYTGYKTQTAAQGFAAKHADLKQFFTRSAAKPPVEEPGQEEE